MNSLHTGLKTKKVYKFIDLCNRNLANRNLPMVVLLSVISSQALANRPAMDEPHEAMQETISEAVNEPAEEMAHRPLETASPASTGQTATEATPSSVDLIMQQQSQQTNGVLKLPAKEIQPGETIRIKVLDFPRRGMSMDKVKNEYGQPIAISDSVGQPPITRWTYKDRVVYFEHSYVIHTVAR